jgi:hypothetical protein
LLRCGSAPCDSQVSLAIGWLEFIDDVDDPRGIGIWRGGRGETAEPGLQHLGARHVHLPQ